jgi:DNA-binding NarL/FixJ family response regulator
MKKINVMIVDDSTFSIAVIKKTLEKIGLNVIATALTMKDAIPLAKEKKPDLITMDMTLSDGNGIDCSKEILSQSATIKIIAISSMMDEEIMSAAKEAGIKGYLQKPIDEDALKSLIEQLFIGEALYKSLQENYEEAFKEAIYSFFKRSIDGDILISKMPLISTTKKSLGISVVVGIIGRHNGRLLIDMSEKTALNLVKKILQDDSQFIDDTIPFLNELANIIGGNACSLLNGLNRAFGLRVSPPTTFHGKDLIISVGNRITQSLLVQTDLGDIEINIGFEKGEI